MDPSSKCNGYIMNQIDVHLEIYELFQQTYKSTRTFIEPLSFYCTPSLRMHFPLEPPNCVCKPFYIAILSHSRSIFDIVCESLSRHSCWIIYNRPCPPPDAPDASVCAMPSPGRSCGRFRGICVPFYQSANEIQPSVKCDRGECYTSILSEINLEVDQNS